MWCVFQFIESVIGPKLCAFPRRGQRSGSESVQKKEWRNAECCSPNIISQSSWLACTRSTGPVFLLNWERKNRTSPRRQTHSNNATTLLRRVNGQGDGCKKKSQDKLRVTSLWLRTITACVWKLIGSLTASFHRAEWTGLFVATGRTKGKQSGLLPLWVCPSEDG